MTGSTGNTCPIRSIQAEAHAAKVRIERGHYKPDFGTLVNAFCRGADRGVQHLGESNYDLAEKA